jgi:hypothetical protein
VTAVLPLLRLHWKLHGVDVTCIACRGAMFRPAPGQTLCQRCWGEVLRQLDAGQRSDGRPHFVHIGGTVLQFLPNPEARPL